MKQRTLEFIVGVFILVAALGLVFLAFKVTDVGSLSFNGDYKIVADFSNIADLKPGAPIRIGGVKVGRVGAITLDPNTFEARVDLLINEKLNNLPVDTSASIYTQGLLGANYIGLAPGFEEAVLKQGMRIRTTHSALVLEKIISQMLYSKSEKK